MIPKAGAGSAQERRTPGTRCRASGPAWAPERPGGVGLAVVATAAAATLGTEIRRYESYSPVTLADPAYAGCCTVTLKTGQDPFTRLRGPYVTEDQAAKVAAASASLCRDPRTVLPVVVPDSPAELVAS